MNFKTANNGKDSLLGKRSNNERSTQDKDDSDQRPKVEEEKEETHVPKKAFKKIIIKKEVNDDCVRAVGSGATAVMLAEKYDEDFSKVKGWLMSEKLDGVRCYWNGKQMYTRGKNIIEAPDWFLKLLPENLALDGELWTKRDDF